MKKAPLMQIYRQLLAAYGPRDWWPAKTAEEVVFGAILTQNTSWKNVQLALSALRQAGKLSFQSVARMTTGELALLIRSSGFFNQKTAALKAFADYFGERYDFSVEKMRKIEDWVLRKELLGLYRVGPETADSILLYALEKPVFVIDAYTKRIFSRHGFLKNHDPYEAYQKFFMDRLPAQVKLFNEFHALIVRTGHLFCKPKPLCAQCPLQDKKRRDHRRSP